MMSNKLRMEQIDSNCLHLLKKLAVTLIIGSFNFLLESDNLYIYIIKYYINFDMYFFYSYNFNIFVY